MVPTTTNSPPAAENRPADQEPQVELSTYNVTTVLTIAILYDRSAMILLHLDMQTLVTFLKSQTIC